MVGRGAHRGAAEPPRDFLLLRACGQVPCFPDVLEFGRKRPQGGWFTRWGLRTAPHGWSAAGQESDAGLATVILEAYLNNQTKAQRFSF